jgi:hypothetical protein
MGRNFKHILLVLFLVSTRLYAQQVTEINPDLLSRPWTAKWVSYPDNSNSEYGVYLFRKEITVHTKPEKFIVHVSADNRYKLYVNGKYVCNGPATSYLFKWSFESIDISPFLHSGKNIISSIVWNFAEHRPLAQISGQTGFIIQGNTKEESIINSDTNWVVLKNTAYKPVPVSINQYYVVGAGEEFNCEKHPWNWMEKDFNTAGWKQAQVVETGKPVGCMGEWGDPSLHLLSQREIPFMEQKNQRFFKVRRTNIKNIPDGFLKGKTPITISANSKVKLLIDQNELTTAYPVLSFSKGRNSTLKLTYFDCPYYEQLQYIGDAKIQALVSTYVSGDSRLTKNAISVLRDSQLPMGITQSRFPSNQPQIIPTFSLVWVTMVYDYWMLNDDSLFVKSMVPGMQETLNWFRNRIDSSGMLGPVEWWNFVDWVYSKGWGNGNPPAANTGNSSILSLQYVYTLEKASEVFEAYKLLDLAVAYRALAGNIKNAVYEKCYDTNKGLIADSPVRNSFSQHANIWAILTNTFPETLDKTKVINTILNDNDLAQSTLYFKFYLFEALEKAGQANQFTEALSSWKEMVNAGLSTFAETPDPARSDCHAWSASPVYYFLSLVAGIKPASPGFKSVRIEPNLGNLNSIDATMPHLLGTIRVKLKKDNENRLSGEITLPNHLDGVFIWNGVQTQLKRGTNKI